MRAIHRDVKLLVKKEELLKRQHCTSFSCWFAWFWEKVECNERCQRKHRLYNWGISWFLLFFCHLYNTNNQEETRLEGVTVGHSAFVLFSRDCGAKLIPPRLQPNFKLNAGAIVCFQGKFWIAVMNRIILGCSNCSFSHSQCVLLIAPFMISD